MRVLLAAGVWVNLGSAEGVTALMHASAAGQIEAVHVLFTAGAQIKQASIHGATALMHASINGQIEAIHVLLAAGAQINQVNAHGWTALMAANREGYVQAVKVFLAAGANPRITTQRIQCPWLRPLPQASRRRLAPPGQARRARQLCVRPTFYETQNTFDLFPFGLVMASDIKTSLSLSWLAKRDVLASYSTGDWANFKITAICRSRSGRLLCCQQRFISYTSFTLRIS